MKGMLKIDTHTKKASEQLEYLFLELMVRIELTTCSLRVNCSAIEPHQHMKFCNADYYTIGFRFCQGLF